MWCVFQMLGLLCPLASKTNPRGFNWWLSSRKLLEVVGGCLGFLWILLRCFHILFFWNIIGWSLHLAWEPNELPGGMIRVWRLMIKWTGTIMNYLWDASTSVECTRMAKRQAISFSRSLILSNSPPGYSSMVFQCCPVPISETGRILWDVFYKTGSLKGVLFLSRSFRSNRPSSTVPFGPSENPSPTPCRLWQARWRAPLVLVPWLLLNCWTFREILSWLL